MREMKIQDYIRAKNKKHRDEIIALEQKAKENDAKAQALDVILGEEDDEAILLGGDTNAE